MSAPAIPLSALALGEHAVIERVEGHDAIGQRLLDLGLIPGTRVTSVRRAPLGDPVVYELRGYRLCLRTAEADRVLVHRFNSSAPDGVTTAGTPA